MLCGAAAWVDAVAVVHLGAARPKSQVVGVDVVEEAGSNVDQAVAILEARTDIRIVFTDIDMPGRMDGMKLAAAVRNRRPPIEIIWP